MIRVLVQVGMGVGMTVIGLLPRTRVRPNAEYLVGACRVGYVLASTMAITVLALDVAVG